MIEQAIQNFKNKFKNKVLKLKNLLENNGKI